MTVIAWDGSIIAVDKQISYGDFRAKGTKCKLLESGEIAVWGGSIDTARLVLEWYENGKDPKKFPISRTEDEAWGEFIIIRPDGRCFSYCQGYIPTEHESPMSWGGIGRYAAQAAMLAGAEARRAVQIACQICEGCGMGVDWFEVPK